MDKVKVKIVKATSYLNQDYYGDYDALSVIYPVSIDWEEVTLAERNEIASAVQHANVQNKNRDEHYILVEYTESGYKEEVFKLATEFKEKMEQDRKREEEKKAEAKRKRKEKALERKKKQFEKLKKELGNE